MLLRKTGRMFLMTILYILLAIAVFVLTDDVDKDTVALIFSVIGISFFIPAICVEILHVVWELSIRLNGTEYIAAIAEIMESATTDTGRAKAYTMFIKVRYFDKEHELRDEWVNTKDMYVYNRDYFVFGQTVKICESDKGICLISGKSGNTPIPETSENSIISDREIITDMSISGITKKPIPEKEW